MKRLTPRQFHVLALIACFFIGAIIVTGASVRVTGSGLGCTSWPNCSEGELVPRSSSSAHAFIEFGNRMFTGLLSLSTIVAVLGSLIRSPKSKKLIWLSAGLVFGVIAQIILGGITVLVGLHPLFVAAHMLVSCVILSNAVVLCVASSKEVAPSLRPLWNRSRYSLIAVLSFLVVIFGTIVTATGPHAGDEDVPRLKASLVAVTRIHSLSAWLLLAIVLYLVVRKKDRSRPLLMLLGVIILQGTWGYVQYALHLPAWMVLVHVLLATILFICAHAYWTRSLSQSVEAID